MPGRLRNPGRNTAFVALALVCGGLLACGKSDSSSIGASGPEGGSGSRGGSSLDGGENLDSGSSGSHSSKGRPDGSTVTTLDRDASVDAECFFGSAGSFATQADLNLFGQVVYYFDGGALPPGHYLVKNLGGCMKYNSTQAWSDQAYGPDAGSEADGFFFVGATTADRLLRPPGTVGFEVGSGGFASFSQCSGANEALPAVGWDFGGGPVGVWLLDDPYSDNIAGEDGGNPRWQLTLQGKCPTSVVK